MKKILLATMEFPPTFGGIATYVADTARNLTPEKVIVYAPGTPGDGEFDQDEPYTIIRKRQLSRMVWPRWIRSAFQMRSIVKKEGIEMIVVNHVLPLGYAAWIVKKLKKIPYIIISHGTDIVYGTRTSWKKKWLRKIMQDSEQIIFNSESLRRRFLERLPEFEHKSTVMYPCPDAIFSRTPDGKVVEDLRRTLALEGKKVVLSVGRLDDGKGFPHLVRAFSEILKKEPHAVWIVIGDGPKREDVIAEIQRRQLQNVVRYIGAIPHEDLPRYYYLADVFVLLTHPDNGREEGLGLVFLEAAAAGLVVVAGKSGGVEEAVQDRVTGRVLDVYHEANKIVDVVAELLGNPEERRRMGDLGKARVAEVFQWEMQLKKLEPWIGPIEHS